VTPRTPTTTPPRDAAADDAFGERSHLDANGKPRNRRTPSDRPRGARGVAARSLREVADSAAIAHEDPDDHRHAAAPGARRRLRAKAGDEGRDRRALHHPPRSEARAAVPADVYGRARRCARARHRQAGRLARARLGEVLFQHARPRVVGALSRRARAAAVPSPRSRDVRVRRDRARQGGRGLRQASESRTRAARRSNTSRSCTVSRPRRGRAGPSRSIRRCGSRPKPMAPSSCT